METKKNILIVQKDLNAYRSGVPKLVLSELKLFTKMGHSTFVCAERIDKSPITALKGIAIKTMRWPISGLYRRKFFSKQVRKVIKKIRPELIIGHGDIVEQDICFIHNCVHLAYEKINNKVIPNDHEMAITHGEILREKKFKVLVCNSQMMKNDLTSRFDLSDKKVVVHYPAFDDEFFSRPKHDIREELNIDSSTVVIGLITSGNFKKRNVKLLIEAYNKIKTDKKIHLLIAGKDKKEPFNELIEKSTNPISFLPPTDQVEKYYNSCDIFVLPALIEEFGLSVLEAMACKKPVIVSPFVGASEVFEGESRNCILEDLKVDTLVNKLQEYLESQTLRESLAQSNFELAKRYSSKDQDEEFIKILKLINFKI